MRLYLHNPKGLEQTQNLQGAKEGSRTISVGLESDITLPRLETWMSEFSGLKCLRSSFLSVCGSVLVFILLEASETHTSLNRILRGLNWMRDEFQASTLKLPKLKDVSEETFSRAVAWHLSSRGYR